MWQKSMSNRAFLLFEIVVALGLLAVFLLIFGRFCRLADSTVKDCRIRVDRVNEMRVVLEEKKRRVYLT